MAVDVTLWGRRELSSPAAVEVPSDTTRLIAERIKITRVE